MENQRVIYRVVFLQNGTQYQVYARYLCEDSLMGFVEIEELVFSENTSSVVVDPSEDRLRSEFKGVVRSYIPLHNILRIDEVKQVGVATIEEAQDQRPNVSPFPGNIYQPTPD